VVFRAALTILKRTFNSFPDSSLEDIFVVDILDEWHNILSIPFRIPVERRTIFVSLEDGKLSIPFRIPDKKLGNYLFSLEQDVFQFLSGFQGGGPASEGGPAPKSFQFLSGFQEPLGVDFLGSRCFAFNSFPDSSCRKDWQKVFGLERLSIPFRIPAVKDAGKPRGILELSIPFRIPVYQAEVVLEGLEEPFNSFPDSRWRRMK